MNFEMISTHVVPDLVLDIGANVGSWYLEAVKAWPKCRFWLIEGNMECEKPLQSILREGDHLDMVLLSDRKKEVDFYTLRDCATSTGASYYRENTPFYEGDNAVATTLWTWPLDELTWETDFYTARDKGYKLLIKADSQGSELDILRGGQKTVAQVEAILMEVTLPGVEYNIGAPRLGEVSRYMAEIGFYAAEKIGNICHPITREHIQSDILYKRLNT